MRLFSGFPSYPRANMTAPTVLRHGAHPPAAGAVDARADCGLRRRRRRNRPPADLHQHGQAADLRLRLLRPAICAFRTLLARVNSLH